MKVLVTGGAGFIGSHITDRLVEKGIETVIVDDLSTGRRENINPKAAFYQVDIRDKSISDVFEKEKPDIVCHHAAQVSVRISVSEPCRDTDINVTGSVNLLENCRRFGVPKFVFASSGGAIYGEQDVFPAPETHATRPLSPYGAAKLAFEGYLFCYYKVFGIKYVALRYSNVYGPRQDPHGEAGVVAIFTSKMLAGETPRINGDGCQTRDYVFVKDVVGANMLAIEKDVTGAFNVGTGKETSVNELYGLIKAATGYKGEAVQGLRSLDDGFVPEVFDPTLLDDRYVVSNREAVATARDLLEKEGIFAGPSSGAILAVAARVAATMERGTIVALLPDGGWKYLSAGTYDRPLDDLEDALEGGVSWW